MEEKKSSILKGKKGLIVGIANERSLAWGIANCIHQHGGELALTYQNDALKKRIIPLATKVNSNNIYEFDIQNYEKTPSFFKNLSQDFGNLDFIVHAVAFSDKEELKGDYVDTTKNNFLNTMEISCYSFTALIREALPFMNEKANFLTLSYYGAEKVIPHYNVMGIAKSALETSVKYLAVDLGKKGFRVNAISAGPLPTLAARSINGFNDMRKAHAERSPLKRNITHEEVANVSSFMLSELSSGITGATIPVDSGYGIMGI